MKTLEEKIYNASLLGEVSVTKLFVEQYERKYFANRTKLTLIDKIKNLIIMAIRWIVK